MKPSEKLAEKIYKELGIKCMPETFHRTYAGRNQQAAGAFVWEMQSDKGYVYSNERVVDLLKGQLEASVEYWGTQIVVNSK